MRNRIARVANKLRLSYMNTSWPRDKNKVQMAKLDFVVAAPRIARPILQLKSSIWIFRKKISRVRIKTIDIDFNKT